MMWIGYAAMWLSLAGAACFGVYETHQPLCLAIMAVGLFVTFETRERK